MSVAAKVVPIISRNLNEETLLCRAVGIPTPYVSWIGPDGVVKIKSTGEARISVKNEEQGEYICMARNAVGSDQKSYTIARKYFCWPVLFLFVLFLFVFVLICVVAVAVAVLFLFLFLFSFFLSFSFFFKQYLFLTFVPKARGLSRELMLQKIQRFFWTSVRHKHTVRKEKKRTTTTTNNNNNNKTKLLQHLKIAGIEKKNDYEVKWLVSII